MMLSQRIRTLNAEGSDGWDLYRRARAMAAAGRPVIDLTIGEHDVKTAEPILREMYKAARAGQTGYAPGEGLPDLRALIAGRIAERTGVPTGPDNVLVTAGGQAGLFAAHFAALDPGQTGLFIDPHYATYPGTIRSVGGKPRAIPARPEAGFQPRARDIEAALDHCPEARSLLINSPNNPTGVVYSEHTLEGIATVIGPRGLWLISDEVYETQVWRGRHLSPRALPGMAERTLVIGSLSKSHAMTGSRIGWVCGPENAISAMADLATNTTYGLPAYIQSAARFALEQGPAFEAGIAEPFRRRRAIAEALIAGQSAVRAVHIEGAMYVFLDIRATGLSGDDFGHALLDDAGVAVMPGESFGPAAAGHVRVAMTVEDRLFEAALSRLLDFAGRQCLRHAGGDR